jgi:hypothetical protein
MLHSRIMQPMKAQVHNGRLVLDEPTDLPEGDVVYVQPVDGIVRVGDGEPPDHEAELHDDLEASLAEADAGQTLDLVEALARRRP